MRVIPLSTIIALTLLAGTVGAAAKDIHVRLPKKSKSTPVQNYNREGVGALESHDYQKAKKLFYKAYLLDPNDPFTLNNLGYVAELEGDVDRAQRFYGLSAAMKSDASVDKSTDHDAEGKPVTLVAGHFEEGTLQVNKLNLEAMSFLIKGRPYEAEKLLNTALQQDPKNAFTLNNLGYDMEQQGELEKAVQFYNQSASLRSDEPVIVAIKKDWRGKPISQIAARNAQRVQDALKKSDTPEAQVALLNLRGVSALNRNDHKTARADFEAAYKKDPDNAFALNNMGYLSELDGDRETAQLYYEKAMAANRADKRVTVASDPHVEGKKLETVAGNSDKVVDTRMEQMRDARRRAQGTGAVSLATRGFSQPPPPVEEAPAVEKQETLSNVTTAPPQATQPLQAPAPQAPRAEEKDPVPAPK